MNTADLSTPEPPARNPRALAVSSRASGIAGRGAGAPPPINVRVAYRAVKRHWWQILLLWSVATAALSALIYVKLKPSYEAISVLRIEPAPRDLFGGGINSGENFEAYLQTQVQLIVSAKVLAGALADPKLAELGPGRAAIASEAVLRKAIQVQVVPRTYLIEVSMRSTSPGDAAAYVNAVVAAYLDLATEWADGATRTHIANLEGYDRRLQAQIDEKQEAWLALADKGDSEHTTPTAGASAEAPRVSRRSVALEQYRSVMDRLLRARADLIEAENVLEVRRSRAARAAVPTQRFEVRAEEAARADPNVIAIAHQVRTALERRDQARRRSRTLNDPAVAHVQTQLDSLSAHYQQTFAAKRRDLLSRFEAEAIDPADGVRDAQEKVDALRHSIARLEPMEQKLESASKQEGSDSVRVALTRESLASLREIQVAVVKRLEQLRFVTGGEPRISRISEASAARQPIKDSRGRYMVLAPIGLIGLVLALFVVAEVRADRVGDPDELSARGRVEILGIVPPLPGRRPAAGERAALEYSNRVQELDQSLEHLRVALCGESVEGVGRCVMITSATGGEGKTNLAVQLAARCASSGESTLLIDADLRRTVLGQLLDLDQGPGLSDVLRGDVPVEAALVAGQIGGFQLLPAGTLGHDPGRLFKGRSLEQLLMALRRTFEVIIIDTPPVLPVPDALILGRWCDGAVLAVRHDNSRFPLVERANRQLSAAGIPVLGAVVTGLRPSKSGYGTYVYGYRNGRSSIGP